MQEKNIKAITVSIIAITVFTMLIFTAGYAYFASNLSLNSANYQLNLPKQVSLVCIKNDCDLPISIGMMTSGNASTTTPKMTNTCAVNCTCTGTPGSVCDFKVRLKESGLPYMPSSGIGTNKELTVKVTSPAGCTAQNSSGTETQLNTMKNKLVSNCTLTVPQGGSISANVTAEFKWYNLSLDQNKHAGRVYSYRLIPGDRLPSEYQEVEYITLTGTQYIKTGFFLSPNTDGFSVTFKSSATSQNGMIVADTGGSTTTGSYIWAYYYNSGAKIGFWTKLGSATASTTLDTNIHTMTYYGKKTYYDDTFISDWTSVNYGTPNYEMLVGANYYSGKYNFFYKGNIYEVVFYRNGAVAMDLVPCYLKGSTPVAGLYDVVGGQFYANSGSGTIGYGAAV